MKSLGEALSGMSACTTDAERVNFLRNLDPRYHVTVKVILKNAFDPAVKWAIPEGAPTVIPVEPSPGALLHGARKFDIFKEGRYPNMNRGRREILFQEFLETLLPEDADLVVAMKDKKMPHGLTRKVAVKAFPDLFA